ncbi:ABC transporter ATP-binding protein [Polynucleobacter paneuropaeus]|nr:ABC transporter ATP-binding protein [Polynucleobacter paneuropaeus]
MKNFFYTFWNFLDLTYKLKSLYVIFLSILSSALEVLSVGSLLPFLMIMINPSSIDQYEFLSMIVDTIIHGSGVSIYTLNLLFFLSVVLFAGLVKIYNSIYIYKYSHEIGAILACNIYQKIINQPYDYHISKNSSEIISAIALKTNDATLCLVTILNIFSAIITIILIIAIGLIKFFYPTVFTVVILILIYLLILKYSKNKLKNNSDSISKLFNLKIKILQESFIGIRNIILDNNAVFYYEKFKSLEFHLKRLQLINTLYSVLPRNIIEIIILLSGAIAIYYLAVSSIGLVGYFPIIGAIIFSVQKMLPLTHQILSGTSNIIGTHKNVLDILEMTQLDFVGAQKEDYKKSRDLVRSINFNSVSFRYPENKNFTLRDVTIQINRGDRVGIVGPSGGGKTTLVDLASGLLKPISGAVKVDGVDIFNSKEWRNSIAYVPQNIFLFDASIRSNITFGVGLKHVDEDRLIDAVERAQMSSFVRSLPDGLETIVGERGTRLSGGQVQRIGIARALYKKVNFLILDEATSAVDGKTESALVDSLVALGPGLTVVMIAHRLSSLRGCNRIFKMVDYGLVEIPVVDLNE